MKIRQGFVSNSSSASFIIKTPISKKELYSLIYKEGFSWPNVLYEELEKTLKFYEKNDFLDKQGQEREEIKEVLNLFEKESSNIDLHKDNIEKVLDLYFDVKHHAIKEDKNGCEISRWISIYNCYSDFGDIIKTIIYLLTLKNKEFTWEIQDD